MASYRVALRPSVEKDLRRLPGSVVSRVFQRIERLKSRPFPPRSVKVAGAEGLYRLRVGDYRIIYGVDAPAGEIVIHYVRHRRDVYRGL